MRKKSLLAVIVAIAMLVIAVTPVAAVTDGQLDGNRHPYVGLMVAQTSTGAPLWRCSGTLLSERLFLTAGHCTEAPAAHVEIWFDADVESGIPANGYPFDGDSAPGLLQPYYLLLRLFHKEALLAGNASALFRATPYVVFGCMWLAGGIVPVLATDLPFAPAADIIALVGIFALARVFSSLAALDIGTSFGGLGARREMMVGFLAEPAMLMTLFTAAFISGSTQLNTIVETLGHREFAIYPSLAFAAVAFARGRRRFQCRARRRCSSCSPGRRPSWLHTRPVGPIHPSASGVDGTQRWTRGTGGRSVVSPGGSGVIVGSWGCGWPWGARSPTPNSRLRKGTPSMRSLDSMRPNRSSASSMTSACQSCPRLRQEGFCPAVQNLSSPSYCLAGRCRRTTRGRP